MKKYEKTYVLEDSKYILAHDVMFARHGVSCEDYQM